MAGTSPHTLDPGLFSCYNSSMLTPQESVREDGAPTKGMLRDEANRARITRIQELQDARGKLLEAEMTINVLSTDVEHWRGVASLLAATAGVLLAVLILVVLHIL